MNVLDFENARMVAERRTSERFREAAEKFHQPETQADYGELWSKINRNPGAVEYLRQVIPNQVKEMEGRYGTNSRTR